MVKFNEMMVASLLQEVNINEKINNAPDSSYEIGVFIGTLLPFIVLVTIAFFIFRYHKSKKE